MDFNILKKNVKKPWGGFRDLAEQPDKWHSKILIIKKGRRLSLQRHKNRREFWIVLEGRVEAQKGQSVRRLKPQDSIFIEKGEIHRLKGLTDSLVAEISFGRHHEDDIERLSDDYGR